MTMLDELPISESQEPEQTELHLDAKIKQNLCMVHVCVKRWTGRVRSKGAKIEVPSDDNTIIEIDGKDMTKPAHILDDQQIFKEIDATEKLVDAVLYRYSVSADEKGFHLVSMSKVGKMIAELIDIREQRQTIIRDRLMPQWEFEIADHIRAKFPNHHRLILSRMPRAESLPTKFDLLWTVRPLTPFSGDDLDPSEVNPEDVWRVIEESNRIVQQQGLRQVQSIYDEVFGEMVNLCNQINDGSLETGRRRSGALDEILVALERVENFGHATSPQIMEQIKAARQTIKSTTIQKVNGNADVQQAIKNAMTPLGESLRNLQDEHRGSSDGRAVRDIIL